jgi:hypothetical protein
VSDTLGFVDFFGERFAVPARINQRLVVKFGRIAAEGGDTEHTDPARALEAAIVLDKMVEQSVRAEDRQRFEDVCDRECPTDEELMGFVASVMAAVSRRPTSPPSGSSGGRTVTPQSAEVDSYSQVIEREEAAGRPDRALMVLMAQESSTT